MAIWFNWSPLVPLLGQYVDDGTRDLTTARVNIVDTGEFEVSVVGTRQRMELIRIATLNSDGNLTEKQRDAVEMLFEHMLAVLRLTHDDRADLFRTHGRAMGIGAHDVDGKPSLNVGIQEILGPTTDAQLDNIRNVFGGSLQHRALTKLLADALTPSLPLQYRYLSLYKIFEYEFRKEGRWSGLAELFQSYDVEYQALGLSTRSLNNLFHEMRDKCAHIKVGKLDNLGVIGMTSPDAKVVTKLLELLLGMLAKHLSAKDVGFKMEYSPTRPTPTVRT